MSRQPDFSSTPRAPRQALAGLVLVALGVLAVAVSGWQAYAARAEAVQAVQKLAEVEREVGTTRARVAVLERARRAARGSTLDPEQAPPARIAAEIAETLPDDVHLQRLSIDYRQGGALELGVVARNAAAWDRLVERLEHAPRIREAELGPEARDGEVRSQVRARWVEPR